LKPERNHAVSFNGAIKFFLCRRQQKGLLSDSSQSVVICARRSTIEKIRKLPLPIKMGLHHMLPTIELNRRVYDY
jgi:hypothetical protein